MNNTVVSLHRQPGFSQLAVVDSVKNGRALTVFCAQLSARPQNVYGHLNSVPVLQEMDEVMVQATEKGLVIVGVIATVHQMPSAQIEDNQGIITVRGARAVRLQTDNAMIEVDHNGRITVDGKMITQQAEGSMSLKGLPIELN